MGEITISKLNSLSIITGVMLLLFKNVNNIQCFLKFQVLYCYQRYLIDYFIHSNLINFILFFESFYLRDSSKHGIILNAQ